MSASATLNPAQAFRLALIGRDPQPPTRRFKIEVMPLGSTRFIARCVNHCTIAKGNGLDAAEKLATQLLGHDRFAALFCDNGRAILVIEDFEDEGGDS